MAATGYIRKTQRCHREQARSHRVEIIRGITVYHVAQSPQP